MWFQIILIVAMLGIALYLLRATPSARHLAIRRVLVLLVLGCAAICVGGIVSMIRHESYSYKKLNGK